ncbi:NAD(P)/FAD-dependent oxidoreductase [Sulfurovum sp. TSL1]|uniref:NAD(P)/FAD-dependent oxidoreductase n=1 Tax=Sulfurovum sp. TSL1 TaxID=2826994 RepID=UPI001CC7DC12|nr:FAD-dependent oxidoreductase [Sulfurovum sp. TSL1]GIT97545.1 NADH dehydrogenase-like protein YumB [Sulfurovum sp. TSL1]
MKDVLIVGGGYGGIAALKTLAPRKDITITLLDQNPYHFLQTEGYSLIAGTLPFDKTIVNLNSLCQSYGENISFIHNGVSHIDLDSKCVYIEQKEQIFYDYLIIATGSVTRMMDSIEGLQNCSYGIKSLRGAFHMKQFFEKELFTRLENHKHAKAHYSIVVGGAGLTGVEIAAEMQHYFNRYYKNNTLACDKITIHLISGSDTVLKGMHPDIIKYATKHLEHLGVILHCGLHISKVEPHKAYLENGEVIDFDFMLFTGGISATAMVRSIEVEHNKLGQIIVNPTLQIPGHTEAFAVGDAAEILDTKGKRIADTAQAAIKSGIHAASNIEHILNGKEPVAADIRIVGLAIAMGGNYAILSIGSIKMRGKVAHYVKKLIENLYKWPLWIRCRFGFNKACEIEG